MKSKSFIDKKILFKAFKDAFIKLDPRNMIKNPVMFVVEIGFIITVYLTLFPNSFNENGNSLYNGIVAGILFITILFANFARRLRLPLTITVRGI